jgi:hypothetical protein
MFRTTSTSEDARRLTVDSKTPIPNSAAADRARSGVLPEQPTTRNCGKRDKPRRYRPRMLPVPTMPTPAGVVEVKAIASPPDNDTDVR